MKNKKEIIKKFLSYFPALYTFFQKIYRNHRYGTFFIPLKLESTVQTIEKAKAFKFNSKNFNIYKKDYSHFLIFKNNQVKNYPRKKLEKLLEIIKEEKKDVAYDGCSVDHVEIASKEFLENYIKNRSLKTYPAGFFYHKNKFKIGNIGSNHRSYNFNGSFLLPSGGQTIGDQGDVTNRLKYIPNLKNKTFLDIGSEEGYAVFDALNKEAKFAKGLNIKESEEYDVFPEHSRPPNITSRDRIEMERTQNFLSKEFGFQNMKNFIFEYKNIYNLSNEQFDFVFCFGVLYHLKNPYLALENLYKVTNETLVIETQGIKNNTYLNAKIDMGDGFIRHSSDSLAFLLMKVGFKKVIKLLDAYEPDARVSSIILQAEK